ncbi:DUF4279 domain-containing protein [Paenibacillus sp. OAS669]|uniref:DUF4279 domain-containing protein n=1 Tax=Paenibacillus sp. OAS669 TaxID=2663821 RepID=UPI00178B26C8|nr:DUF4279 domain-containing protein [Paenibacillus sp. OAS669]MBE1442607.1 hypothetical protein [Paenibacillus sp. OAS669]
MSTKVSAEFSIIGDTFDPKIVTDMLGLNPTGSYVKGELVTGKNLVRKESCWFIKTEHEPSLDVNEQLEKIIKLINGRKKKLIELRNQIVVDYKFFIVIKIEENQVPAIFLSSDIVEFAGNIQAEIEFDVYIH